MFCHNLGLKLPLKYCFEALQWNLLNQATELAVPVMFSTGNIFSHRLSAKINSALKAELMIHVYGNM